MATFAMALLAGSVAAGYFTIAAVVAPRIRMPSASSRIVLIVRGAAIAFFIGCGMTHVHILLHTVGYGATQPVEMHELVFQGLQALGHGCSSPARFCDLSFTSCRARTRQQLRAAVDEQRRLAHHAQTLAGRDELNGLARRCDGSC